MIHCSVSFGITHNTSTCSENQAVLSAAGACVKTPYPLPKPTKEAPMLTHTVNAGKHLAAVIPRL